MVGSAVNVATAIGVGQQNNVLTSLVFQISNFFPGQSSVFCRFSGEVTMSDWVRSAFNSYPENGRSTAEAM